MDCGGDGMSGGNEVPSTATSSPRHVEPDAVRTSPGSSDNNKAIASGVLWQGSLRWLSQVVAWSATLVVARRLSPEDYGIAGSAGVFVGLLILLTDGGIGRALVLRREKDVGLISQSHGASLLIGLASAVLLMLAAIPLSRFYQEPRLVPVLAVIALVPLISSTYTVPLARLQQRLEFRRVATVDFCKSVVQGVVVLLCAVAGLRYWSLVAGLIAGHLTALGLTTRFERVQFARPKLRDLEGTLVYARHLAVGSMAWYVYSNADFAVVGRVAGIAALGYYQFAWNVAQLPGEKLGNVLQAVTGPFFGSIGDDFAALRHYFLILSELMVSVMLPVLLGFALVCPLAVPLIFGAKWVPSVQIMQILVLSAAVGSLGQLGHHVLGATGRAHIGTRMNLIALVVLPIAFFLAARFSGTLAVAAVWLVAQPVLMGIPLLYVRAAIGLSLREYLYRLRAPAVSAVAMTVAVLSVERAAASLPLIARLALMCAAGAAAYPLCYTQLFRPRVDALVALLKSRH